MNKNGQFAFWADPESEHILHRPSSPIPFLQPSILSFPLGILVCTQFSPSLLVLLSEHAFFIFISCKGNPQLPPHHTASLCVGVLPTDIILYLWAFHNQSCLRLGQAWLLPLLWQSHTEWKGVIFYRRRALPLNLPTDQLPAGFGL